MVVVMSISYIDNPVGLALGVRGLHWVFVACVGCLWPALGFRGLRWVFMTCVGVSWPALAFRGLRWVFMACVSRRELVVLVVVVMA